MYCTACEAEGIVFVMCMYYCSCMCNVYVKKGNDAILYVKQKDGNGMEMYVVRGSGIVYYSKHVVVLLLLLLLYSLLLLYVILCMCVTSLFSSYVIYVIVSSLLICMCNVS